MKWYRAVGFLAVVAFTPGIAAANEVGAYVSVGGLYVMPTDSDLSSAEDNWELTATVPLEGGPGLTAAIGYGASNGLRAELEFGYRSSSWNDYDDLALTIDGEPIDFSGADIDADDELSTLSLMANGFMVFDASWGLKPYVGAGIGFAQHEASGDDSSVTYQGTTLEFESYSEDDTVLAYQVMVGMTYPISEKSEARLGYRYFATGEADFEDVKAEYASHNVELGILFRF